IIALGVLWGIVKAYGHIEARTVWLMFPMVGFLIVLCYTCGVRTRCLLEVIFGTGLLRLLWR
ncbi:MAG: hypothetical protein WA996_21915, partial [Candidatus Promineifilaceae bacterium]